MKAIFEVKNNRPLVVINLKPQTIELGKIKEIKIFLDQNNNIDLNLACWLGKSVILFSCFEVCKGHIESIHYADVLSKYIDSFLSTPLIK